MGLDYHASSPCLVIPPSQPTNLFSDIAPFRQSPRSTPPPSSIGRKYPIPPSLNYLAATSNSSVGRKRSIEDVEPDDLSLESVPAAPVQKPAARSSYEPIYGPGMTISYPDDLGFSIAAESQTGTWAEEKHDIAQEEKAARPIAVSRKSARLDRSASIDETVQPLNIPAEDIIDERGNTINTLMVELGIGWKNIMTNKVLGDAARAYSRVIENHFSLSEPLIMLESEGLSAYFVRAKQDGAVKFWLFHDSLSWCQLVGHTLNQAVENLKAGPVPRVEGPQIQSTPRTPPPSQPAASVEDVDMKPLTTMTNDVAMQM